LKILVIGSKGQLGWELCRRSAGFDQEIVGLDLPDLDITKPEQIRNILNDFGACLVVNAAAYTAVDKAEAEPDPAFAVNTDGPGHLAVYCAEANIPLIHLSTDYVFDGEKEGAYTENDPPAPLGVYGKSKAAGEEKVRKHLREHIILRTAWLYGSYGHNFVKTILRSAKVKEVLRVVADQHGCPTYAGDLAEAILAISNQIQKQKRISWGTYHYCGAGVTTWHGFAEKIIELSRKHDSFKVLEIRPITTEDYPTPARRPKNSVLDCSLIGKQFGIYPKPWLKSLENMLERLRTVDD
jgi:dTDP-4-dehydrorhamnose reductase